MHRPLAHIRRQYRQYRQLLTRHRYLDSSRRPTPSLTTHGTGCPSTVPQATLFSPRELASIGRFMLGRPPAVAVYKPTQKLPLSNKWEDKAIIHNHDHGTSVPDQMDPAILILRDRAQTSKSKRPTNARRAETHKEISTQSTWSPLQSQSKGNLHTVRAREYIGSVTAVPDRQVTIHQPTGLNTASRMQYFRSVTVASRSSTHSNGPRRSIGRTEAVRARPHDLRPELKCRDRCEHTCRRSNRSTQSASDIQ